MRRIGWAVAVLVLMPLAGSACQRQSAGPTVSEYAAQRQAALDSRRVDGGARAEEGAQATGDPRDAIAAGRQMYTYSPIGKRDPFRAFILERVEEGETAKGPLEQFDLVQLMVAGVVWETNRPRALIVDPSGKNYIVREGDVMGKNDGRVIAIDDSKVRVRETYVDFHGERTTKDIDMRVRQSQGG